MKSTGAQNQRRDRKGAVRLLSVVLLAFLATGSGTVWAGINEWTNVGPEGGIVRFLAVDPQNPSTVYAATRAGMFKAP